SWLNDSPAPIDESQWRLTLTGAVERELADVRRLEIAKAIATEPELLLLDEPFAGLNQAEIRELSEQLRAVHAEGVTILIIDHNMKGLMELVDRVIVINNGEFLAEGSPEEIADDERVKRAYLAGAEVTE
ncbi:MAG: hypothetical protein IH933_14840, partial [Euryarchaeota archaeon]|nr:hypothetical protein [Euryarchaeota archaeon]